MTLDWLDQHGHHDLVAELGRRRQRGPRIGSARARPARAALRRPAVPPSTGSRGTRCSRPARTPPWPTCGPRREPPTWSWPAPSPRGSAALVTDRSPTDKGAVMRVSHVRPPRSRGDAGRRVRSPSSRSPPRPVPRRRLLRRPPGRPAPASGRRARQGRPGPPPDVQGRGGRRQRRGRDVVLRRVPRHGHLVPGRRRRPGPHVARRRQRRLRRQRGLRGLRGGRLRLPVRPGLRRRRPPHRGRAARARADRRRPCPSWRGPAARSRPDPGRRSTGMRRRSSTSCPPSCASGRWSARSCRSSTVPAPQAASTDPQTRPRRPGRDPGRRGRSTTPATRSGRGSCRRGVVITTSNAT